MAQPTLASIPGILLRTSLRLVARILFAIASTILLVGATVLAASALLATWRTPRSRRTQLLVEIIELGVLLAKDRNRVTKTD